MSQQLWFTVIAFHTIVLFLPFSMMILYRRPKSWNSIFALFLGLVVAFIDLQTDEVQFPSLLLLAFGFFLGFAQPKRAWEPATSGFVGSRRTVCENICRGSDRTAIAGRTGITVGFRVFIRRYVRRRTPAMARKTISS